MADPRTYIKVHDGMPDHPKVDGLSDRAFRLLVESWCWCSRHLTDGAMPAATWRKRGTDKARKELIDAGLVEVTRDGVQMHDYLEHQRSAEEVRELRAAKGKGGSIGNHVRWHVSRGRFDPDCEHCADPRQIANGSHPASQMRSQTDRKTSPETVSETETDRSRGSVARSSSLGDARATDDDDLNSKIDQQITAILTERTGRPVAPDHAARVRHQILDGRPDVRDPLRYVTSAVRGEPHRYAPPADGQDAAGAAVIAAVRNTDPDQAAAATGRGIAAVRAQLRKTPSREDPHT